MGFLEYMGMRSPTANGHSVALADAPQQTLASLLETHEIISATEDALVVQARTLATPAASRADLREYGASGSSSWGSWSTSDYNPDVAGHQGLRKFDEMRRSDGLVASALLLRKTPILAARWYIEPASQQKRDRKIATELWKNLTQGMTISWPRFLRECLLHIDFGVYPFEKVLEKIDGQIRWRKFAPRHPLEITEVDYDDHGGPNGIWFNAPAQLASYRGTAKFPTQFDRFTRPGEVYIPIRKLLVFTHAQEGGNIMGISLQRPMYKHHYITDVLYKIDAIQKERHGIGIPIIKLPPQASTGDKKLADQMGRNLRTNEKAHVVLPPMWEIATLKLEGNLVDPILSSKHHNTMILSSVLGQFMESGQGAATETLVDLFMKASRNDAEIVRDTLNKWAIEEWVRFNYGSKVDPPQLQVRRIGEAADARVLSFSLRNLVGAGLLRPDKTMIDAVRQEYDLPMEDPATLIQAPAPQAPSGAPAGPPRQSQAQNMNRGKNPGKANTGDDKSGGS